MIDLHTHTDQSDGTLTPVELIGLARQTGVTTLGITDHDTFAGYEQALPFALDQGVELICGIELSTKFEGQSVHLLAYFPEGLSDETRAWVAQMRISREERNRRLIERLREQGVSITLEEVHAKSRTMTGRPHFAQVLVEKKYAASVQDAFDTYLDKSASCYVERDEPQLVSSIRMVRAQGGLSSLAHPCRFDGDLDAALPELRGHGLNAIEAYYSDHTEAETQRYLSLAQRHGLWVTGGSDFHGTVKPGIALGSGRHGNLCVPAHLLTPLRTIRKAPEQRPKTQEK